MTRRTPKAKPADGRARHIRWVRSTKRIRDLVELGKYRATLGEITDVSRVALLVASALAYPERGRYTLKKSNRHTFFHGLNLDTLTSKLREGRFAEAWRDDDLIKRAHDTVVPGTWIGPDRGGAMIDLMSDEREICRITTLEACDESRTDRLARRYEQAKPIRAAKRKAARDKAIADGKRVDRKTYLAQFAARREKAAKLGKSVDALRKQEKRAAEAAEKALAEAGSAAVAASDVVSTFPYGASGVVSASDVVSPGIYTLGRKGHNPGRSGSPVIAESEHPDVQGDVASASSEQRAIVETGPSQTRFLGDEERAPKTVRSKKKTARPGRPAAEEPAPLMERSAEPSQAEVIRAGSTAILPRSDAAFPEPNRVEAPRAPAHAPATEVVASYVSTADLFGSLLPPASCARRQRFRTSAGKSAGAGVQHSFFGEEPASDPTGAAPRDHMLRGISFIDAVELGSMLRVLGEGDPVRGKALAMLLPLARLRVLAEAIGDGGVERCLHLIILARRAARTAEAKAIGAER